MLFQCFAAEDDIVDLDLGAHGMGIPVGKSIVYGASGIDPRQVLPVCVDVGCDTETVREDPLYLGARHPRIDDREYYAFMDEVVAGIQSHYSDSVLIHWEDVSSRHSNTLLQQLRSQGVPTFNDDIEATSAIVLAALLGAQKLQGVLPLAQQRFLFFGAGQTNVGCAKLLVAALQEEGLLEQQAISQIYLMDSRGLLLSGRDDLTPDKVKFAKTLPGFTGNPRDLVSLVNAIQPTTLIGASSQGGAFTKTVIQAMVAATQEQAEVNGYRGNARPTVFALSNPSSRSECSYQDAYEWSNGRVVYASGTQFPSIQVAGRPDGAGPSVLQPAQCNNCYVFPGIGMGWLASGAADVTPGMLLAAAAAVAEAVKPEDVQRNECVLPPVSQLQDITLRVAAAVAETAAVEMVAVPNRYCSASLASVGQATEGSWMSVTGRSGSARFVSMDVSDQTSSRVQDCLQALVFKPRQMFDGLC